MSLYGEYIQERLGDGIVEVEEGFASYRFLNEGKSVYIVDIFVKKHVRKVGLASKLADEVVKIAVAAGAKELIGTVVPSANWSTDSLKVLLGYGMKLKSASENMIVFSKEI